ncbi:hypothetical protein CEXT_103571 [Caerostris extrusa]|uniref:Uncharacterized protein n=1 Tax=Caerostris extrusa TaxID=172846 RepID=A0AAV4PNA4_CAEEX|nr:hypothetical protein CEXT_103571 [Caerostris extrusa]
MVQTPSNEMERRYFEVVWSSILRGLQKSYGDKGFVMRALTVERSGDGETPLRTKWNAAILKSFYPAFTGLQKSYGEDL